MHHRLTALFAGALVTCLASTSCGGTTKPQRSANAGFAKDGTFTMVLPSDPGTFDPYRSQLIFGRTALAYDALVNLRPDGRFVSGLAEKWNADARSATFTIRPGVTCSDGTPLTARQVAAAINYVTNPKNGSAQYGVNTPTEPLRATADDPTRTVRVVMTKKPFGFLLNTIGQLPIVCAKGLADPKLYSTGSDGTGPFVLTKVVPGQSYTFTRRDGYTWGPGGASTKAPGTPAKVVLRIVPNESTTANLLLSGEVNFAQITGDDQQRLIAQGLDRVKSPGAGGWLFFNQLPGRPWADIRLRQALVQAIDINQLVKVNTGGTGSPSTGLVALLPKPCTGNTVAGRLPRRDVATAQALLDQAGWAKGPDGIRQKNGKPLTLDLDYYVGYSAYGRPTAELLAEQWKPLGIKVRISGNSAVQHGKVMFQTSNYDVYMQGFGVNLPSQLVPYFSGPVPPKGVNLAGIHNTDYERLVAKASALSPPDSCGYWNQAEQALFRNLDIAPIADWPRFYYLKNAQAQITGFSFPIPTSIRVFS